MIRSLVWSRHHDDQCSVNSIRSGNRNASATPKKPVTDTYQGVQVVDDYRWLENSGDPAVRQWAEAQNKFHGHTSIKFPARRHCMRD